jgi:hypothetical protein
MVISPANTFPVLMNRIGRLSDDYFYDLISLNGGDHGKEM